MLIREIKSHDYSNINQEGTVLIQFYQNDSKECERITKEIEKIPEEGLYFYALKFNIDENKEFAKSFNIESGPILLMVKGNQILGRKESFMTAEEIFE
jgi:thioredoxin-like negative regulator of GroEL